MTSFIPAWCFECRKIIYKTNRSESGYLCQACYGRLPFFDGSACPKCGRSHRSERCEENWGSHISTFLALFKYEEPVHRWISSLKYSRNLTAGKTLQYFIKNWLKNNSDCYKNIDLLISVPVHPLRLRQRGFNQASYLLNKQQHYRLKSSIVKKIRHTSHQAGMTSSERRKNLKNSFKVSGSLKDKNILLFDDVCTTGQTLAEVSSCLKKAGAKRIDVFVLARTILA